MNCSMDFVDKDTEGALINVIVLEPTKRIQLWTRPLERESSTLPSGGCYRLTLLLPLLQHHPAAAPATSPPVSSHPAVAPSFPRAPSLLGLPLPSDNQPGYCCPLPWTLSHQIRNDRRLNNKVFYWPSLSAPNLVTRGSFARRVWMEYGSQEQ